MRDNVLLLKVIISYYYLNYPTLVILILRKLS